MVVTREGGEGKDGRGDWIRTSDLSVPNRALYQAEPRPAVAVDALRTALDRSDEPPECIRMSARPQPLVPCGRAT